MLCDTHTQAAVRLMALYNLALAMGACCVVGSFYLVLLFCGTRALVQRVLTWGFTIYKLLMVSMEEYLAAHNTCLALSTIAAMAVTGAATLMWLLPSAVPCPR